MVHFDWSGYLSCSDQNVPIPSTIILYPAYKSNNHICCDLGQVSNPKCTVPFKISNRNFCFKVRLQSWTKKIKKIWIPLPPNQGWGKRCVLALTQLHPWLGGGVLLHHFIILSFTTSFYSVQDCRYKVFDMILIFYLQTNKTHLHKNSFALKLVLKVRIFGTQPIRPSQEANKKTIVSTAWSYYFVL